MHMKEKIADRLNRAEVMEGVLPTNPKHSEMLSGAARSLRENDLDAARLAAATELETSELEVPAEPATPIFSGSSDLREQVAGFAEAGVNFFYAPEPFWRMAPDERRSRGGNGAVTRLLVSDQRILLETPRVIVSFMEGTADRERKAILERYQVHLMPSPGLPPNTVKCAVTDGLAVERSLALMEENAVRYAEPDFVEHIGARFTPVDPEFAQQWHHANIQAEEAWDFTKGEGVVVTVIDNGFDSSHPDLAFGPRSGWYRPTPDLMDADFVAGTTHMPDVDHGTACAGMIAARSGNGSGGCGVAFGAELNMVACGPDQVGTQSTLARAVAYAARYDNEGGPAGEGSDIIACSLGPNGAHWTMRAVLSDAIDFAAGSGRGGKGCLIVWACTNGNFPISADEVCSHREVSAVGRSRDDDEDDGSGFGQKLEFLAPGVWVYIPTSGGGYRATKGTSFAAPCAAGVAALALSQNRGLTAVELRQLLRDTCDRVGSLPYIDGHNARFGHGRVNAARAVSEARSLAAGS